MNEKIAAIQKLLGVAADGAWGPKSQAALERAKSLFDVPDHLNPQLADQNDSTGSAGTQKWPREADAKEFYGDSDGSSVWEAVNLVTFAAPYVLFMDGQLVHHVRCHRKVENSLFKILSAIRQFYGSQEVIHAVGLDQYDGCYNFRNVRGAGHLSMHAYGAAVDFDAAHNALGSTQGRMPKEVVSIFKKEGWRWGGDYANRKDFMHFEACS